MSKKLCKDTEIKAFSHWHFEFSMARFWTVPVFSNEVWTVWSAYTMADFPAQPGRPHGQTYQHKSPLENGEIFLYARSWLVGQRNRCWIKGLGKKSTKRVGSIVVCSAFCPGSPKCDPLDSKKMAILHVLCFTVGKSFAWRHVNRCEVVKYM